MVLTPCVSAHWKYCVQLRIWTGARDFQGLLACSREPCDMTVANMPSIFQAVCFFRYCGLHLVTVNITLEFNALSTDLLMQTTQEELSGATYTWLISRQNGAYISAITYYRGSNPPWDMTALSFLMHILDTYEGQVFY